MSSYPRSDGRNLGLLRGYFPSSACLPLVVLAFSLPCFAQVPRLVITWQDVDQVASMALYPDGTLSVPQDRTLYPSAGHVLSAIEGYCYAMGGTPFVAENSAYGLHWVWLPVGVGYWGGNVYGYYITDLARSLHGYEATKNTFQYRYVGDRMYCHIDKGDTVEIVGCAHPYWAGYKSIVFASCFCNPLADANEVAKEDKAGCPAMLQDFDLGELDWVSEWSISPTAQSKNAQKTTFFGHWANGAISYSMGETSNLVDNPLNLVTIDVESLWEAPPAADDLNVRGCMFQVVGFNGVRWGLDPWVNVTAVTFTAGLEPASVRVNASQDLLSLTTTTRVRLTEGGTPSTTRHAVGLSRRRGGPWMNSTLSQEYNLNLLVADGLKEFLIGVAALHDWLGGYNKFRVGIEQDIYVYKTMPVPEGGREYTYWYPFHWDTFYKRFVVSPASWFGIMAGGTGDHEVDGLLCGDHWDTFSGMPLVVFDKDRQQESISSDSASGMLSVKILPTSSGEGTALVPAQATGTKTKTAIEQAKDAIEDFQYDVLDTLAENLTAVETKFNQLKGAVEFQTTALEQVIDDNIAGLDARMHGFQGQQLNAEVQRHTDAENARSQRDTGNWLLSQILDKDFTISVNTAETTSAVQQGNALLAGLKSGQEVTNQKLTDVVGQQMGQNGKLDEIEGHLEGIRAGMDTPLQGTAYEPSGGSGEMADSIGGMAEGMMSGVEGTGAVPDAQQMGDLGDAIAGAAADEDSGVWKVPIPFPREEFFRGHGGAFWEMREFTFYNAGLLWILGLFRSVCGLLVSVRFALGVWHLLVFAMTQGAASKGE